LYYTDNIHESTHTSPVSFSVFKFSYVNVCRHADDESYLPMLTRPISI